MAKNRSSQPASNSVAGRDGDTRTSVPLTDESRDHLVVTTEMWKAIMQALPVGVRVAEHGEICIQYDLVHLSERAIGGATMELVATVMDQLHIKPIHQN